MALSRCLFIGLDGSLARVVRLRYRTGSSPSTRNAANSEYMFLNCIKRFRLPHFWTHPTRPPISSEQILQPSITHHGSFIHSWPRPASVAYRSIRNRPSDYRISRYHLGLHMVAGRYRD